MTTSEASFIAGPASSRTLVAALALALAAAGCATTSVVEDVRFAMVTPQDGTRPPDSLMRPGTTLKVGRVALTDAQGTTRAPEEPGEISVEVKGGSYDAQTGEVTFSEDPNAVPPEGYEVAVIHADGARSVQRFKPDFALILGPSPEDVRSFRVGLIWRENGTVYSIEEGTPLIPGEEYELRAVVDDVHGRKFTSTDSNYPIPADRIDTTLTGFRPSDSNGNGLVAQGDLGEIEARYALEARYGGVSTHIGTLSFPFDAAIADGPEPDAVTGIEFVGDLAAQGSISPGAVKNLQVRVSDAAGRSWTLGLEDNGSHVSNEFPLPRSRLVVQAENAAYGTAGSEVRFNDDARAMLGEEYRVLVRYADDPRLEVESTYAPDFLSIVPLMDADELTHAGMTGRDGREGRDGQQGSRGNDSARVLGRAGDGRAGGHGTSGQNGARGSPGPNLRIIAREVRTIDATERLVLFEIRAPGVRPQYYIRSIDAPPVAVVTRGGAGGPGGAGGNGGVGGNGGDGYYSGDGGDGGNAGAGGDGGDGGNGGTINLILTTHELEKAFVLDSQGGVGGTGGEEGASGQPGIPGSVDSWTADDDNKKKDLPPPEVGAYGNEGNIGYTGRAGHDGLPGLVQLAVDETQAAALVRRVPEDIQKVILY